MDYFGICKLKPNHKQMKKFIVLLGLLFVTAMITHSPPGPSGNEKMLIVADYGDHFVLEAVNFQIENSAEMFAPENSSPGYFITELKTELIEVPACAEVSITDINLRRAVFRDALLNFNGKVIDPGDIFNQVPEKSHFWRC
jgi:hypothetical protein